MNWFCRPRTMEQPTLACAVVVLSLAAMTANAASFDPPYVADAPFNSIEGVHGKVDFTRPDASYEWHGAGSAQGDGFAVRTVSGAFLLTLQLRAADRGLRFGLRVAQAEGGLQTQLDAAGNIELRSATGSRIQLAKIAHPDVFQVERQGDELIFSAARFGATLTEFARQSVAQQPALRVGVYRHFGAHDHAALSIANLRWTTPAWQGLQPYKDYLGSRLELVDVDSGAREVLYTTTLGIEAPNWTPDGKAITFNSAGRIYRFDVATRSVAPIDTGTRIKNNNDHVISFDGKWLGISNHSSVPGGESLIYKLPIGGGEPQALTTLAPSYLHGWSPDGKYIIYTASRNGQFDIYRTTTDGAAVETQLTNTPGLDDGSEYAPDGKHIYFNSSRTGLMQLWRMQPDGTAPQQLTSDNFNNWFPHVSPDNQRLAFLSYLPTIAADQHPYYQHVYLRSMPAHGGTPRVIAYLYGGQGTINVPSWSPDGKHVAFISNSALAAPENNR